MLFGYWYSPKEVAERVADARDDERAFFKSSSAALERNAAHYRELVEGERADFIRALRTAVLDADSKDLKALSDLLEAYDCKKY